MLPELSLCIGLIMIILYGLFSLSMSTPVSSNSGFAHLNSNVAHRGAASMVSLYLKDVYFFSRLWPLMFLLGYGVDAELWSRGIAEGFVGFTYPGNNGIDLLLIILTMILMQSFKSFESVLLLLLAFVGQIFMLHSCDLVSFYICLEAQNFCFLVLCGLQPKGNALRGSRRPLAGVEASIKYLLLSAFSSGVLLFWFSNLYLQTGMTSLSWNSLNGISFDSNYHHFMEMVPQMLILIALMFKLGGAPLHLWMVDIYSGVKRQLLMYFSTAPKLSLFGFWVSTWHSVWTDFTILLFVALSMVIGCFGAYYQPTLRALFAYSTLNEIGLMLMAIETAGFHSLFQHLSIYIVTMLLLWNNGEKRFFSVLAVSLAGMPPLAGFFGKAWIFQSVATGSVAGGYLAILMISLFCTGLSLVYYLRVFRLFTMSGDTSKQVNTTLNQSMEIQSRTYSTSLLEGKIKLTSLCVTFLIFAPLFYLKPFVL